MRVRIAFFGSRSWSLVMDLLEMMQFLVQTIIHQSILKMLTIILSFRRDKGTTAVLIPFSIKDTPKAFDNLKTSKKLYKVMFLYIKVCIF